METIWYAIIAFTLTAYVILDGFDLGTGVLHLLLARSEDERRLTLAAIGPFWDGNEVWLLAAGGVLYMAFPAVYAASFSGFYLPLIMILWLFMLRGIGIEFRSHIGNPMWKSFCDVIFSLSSLLLATFLGVGLANVIRGVPLNSEGYFFEPLWTTFALQQYPGILDWYTVFIGIFAVVTLAAHGANYVALKTDGALNKRARKTAAITGCGMGILAPVGLIVTLQIRPEMLENYRSYGWGALFPITVALSLAGFAYFRMRANDFGAFLASGVFIAGMLGGAAFALYPFILPATTDPAFGMTVHNSAASAYGLRVGLTWWVVGMTLAIGYFFILFRLFRGKVG
jgi:cytochrome bd ubiquinol oxidase subunit II